MRLFAEHLPEKAVAFSFVMMQQRFSVIKSLLRRDRAEAEAADVFDAAAVHNIRKDGESLFEIAAVFLLQVGNRTEQFAQARYLAAQAFEQLLGAEVQVNVSARIKLRRDF